MIHANDSVVIAAGRLIKRLSAGNGPQTRIPTYGRLDGRDNGFSLVTKDPFFAAMGIQAATAIRGCWIPKQSRRL